MIRLEKIKKFQYHFPEKIWIAPDFDFYVQFCAKLKFSNFSNFVIFLSLP